MPGHRIAVIGCGSLARSVHLPNICRNPRLELVVACDHELPVAEECKLQFGAVRSETDWRRVVSAPDVDLILLATHTSLRGELIVPALMAGKPVYTEKPVSADKKELDEILLTARKTGVPVCVGHNRRSSPAMLEFKRLLDKAKTSRGFVPSILRDAGREQIPEEKQLQVLMRVNDDARSWKDWIFADREGILFAEMVHFIDLALWFNDATPTRIFAEGSQLGNFTLIIRFHDGSITTIQHTMVGHFDYPKELYEVTVNNITLAMDHHIEVRQMGMLDEPPIKTFPYAEGCEWAEQEGMTGFVLAADREHRTAGATGREPRWLNVRKGHYEHLDRFLDHLDGTGENPCDVESAYPVNRLAVKFLESINSGCVIEIGSD